MPRGPGCRRASSAVAVPAATTAATHHGHGHGHGSSGTLKPPATYSDFVKIDGDEYDPLRGRRFGKSVRNFVRRAMECFGIGQIGKKAALVAAQSKRKKPSGPNDWIRFARACFFEQK